MKCIVVGHYKGRAMTQKFKPGDKVAWNTSQGPTTGTVKKKLTGATHIKGHHIAASADDPQFLVETAKSGQIAAHKPAALRKKS